MDIGIVSVRYAKALLRFASENNEAEQVYEEMKRLSALYVRFPKMQDAMLNPILSDEQKTELLSAACMSEGKPSASALRFIKLVTEKKRCGLMLFIAHSYLTLYRKAKNITNGKLVVPVKISAEVSNKLRAIVEQQANCQIDFEVLVDSEIEGGFILEYDTYRLDASLKSQMERLHRALKN